MKYTLAIDRCGRHNYHAVSVNSDDGIGQRLTPSKCCGSWSTLKAWPMTKEELRKVAHDILQFIGETP